MNVTVAVQHEINAMGFQDRDEVLPNLDQVAFVVRIVRAVRVGRMMKVNNNPLGGRGLKVIDHPLEHGGVGRVSTGFGVETDQVNVRVVEGIILLGA